MQTEILSSFSSSFLLFLIFNFFTIKSSKSPVPDPVVAEIGIGSPRESLLN
jgi:hypothetical protein